MSEYMTLVVKTKSFRPILRLLRCRYRAITIEYAREDWIRLLRVHLYALILLALGLAVIVLISNGAMGQTADKDLRSVIVDHHGRQRLLLVDDSSKVADVLDTLAINPGHLDIVSPTQDTLINRDDFEITVQAGKLVEILDGDQHSLLITLQSQPREIVLTLGYQLESGDNVIQHDRGEDEPSLIEIQRSGDYHFNIDGQLTTQKANSESVGNILAELGHAVDDIAYVRPYLHQEVSDNSLIVVYYDKPNQDIIIETQISRADGQLIEREFVYQVLYDTATGVETERNLIEDYLIRQVALDSLPDEEANAPNSSTSHQVGDFSEQQQSWLRAAGIAERDWFYVDYIIFHESRWRHLVWNNGGSGAYGLCQALPAHKMSSFGDDYLTNPVVQLRWCDWYAKNRYGSWQAAYQSWLIQHWW